MADPHTSFRIYKTVLKITEDLEKDEDFPIQKNKSLIVALALWRFSNEWYSTEDKTLKRIVQEIKDDIAQMIDDGIVDKNVKGYDREDPEELTCKVCNESFDSKNKCYTHMMVKHVKQK